MIHTFLDKYKEVFIGSILKLKGSDKRIMLAKTAEAYSKGGQSVVANLFNVGRDTIRKGKNELQAGIACMDAFNARGRKKTEEVLPNLTEDIIDIVDSQSQTDPDFKTRRLFTRLTVPELRIQLIKQKGYQDEELPTNQTLNRILNDLGYHLKKVMKTKPLKRIDETDVIFLNVDEINCEYKGKSNVMHISIDTKDRVKIGNFSRGGKSRVCVKANDHDFGTDYLTPFGIVDVNTGHVELTFTETKVTPDFMVDCIEAYWLKKQDQSYDTLIINADNGPENSSRRMQYMKRIIQFAVTYNVTVILAYYPPYHSKYNPIERVWGCLEQHWNGSV
ncbi:ISAzo13 family transposase [Filibacter tadaridae]|uniref:Rhodopirellula transposase n=1 Tax=Filibacter tadaridae TaxID=2483811 RepID=A0A3P5X5H6_9BACL|nr:ISAzo13 family transposase [Filibacter tadaridae]VDC29535.1 Rhodopirellula transposase [Filibacter tadaridae]